jgi:histidyl-tRNA synthetase
VYVANADAVSATRAFLLARDLRRATLGMRTVCNVEGRSLKAQLRQADQGRFRYCVILGERELQAGVATVKDLEQGAQETAPLAELAAWLGRRTESAGQA